MQIRTSHDVNYVFSFMPECNFAFPLYTSFPKANRDLFKERQLICDLRVTYNALHEWTGTHNFGWSLLPTKAGLNSLVYVWIMYSVGRNSVIRILFPCFTSVILLYDLNFSKLDSKIWFPLLFLKMR